MKHVALKTAGIAFIAGLALAGCTNSEQASDSSSSTAPASSVASESSATQAPDSEKALSFDDAVVRASTEGKDMTAAFGEFHNNTDKDINIVGVSSKDIKAKKYQLHEVVNGVMQEKEGGFIVPAGGSLKLAPGGNHFMFMEMTEPVMAGDDVDLTVEFADGSTITYEDIPVRTFGAGDEDYGDFQQEGHEGHENHEGHDHSDHEGH